MKAIHVLLMKKKYGMLKRCLNMNTKKHVKIKTLLREAEKKSFC